MLNQDSGFDGSILEVLGGDILNKDLLDTAPNQANSLGDLIAQMGQSGQLPPAPVNLNPVSVSDVPVSDDTSVLPNQQNRTLANSAPQVDVPDTTFPEPTPILVESQTLDLLSGLAASEPRISDDGFVLQLGFDQVEGNQIIDTSPAGDSNIGTLRNGATVQSSPEFGGNVLYLEGGNDVLAIADTPDLI